MAIIKCKMCGGDIELSPDKTFGTCEYCGSTMTFPKVDDEQRAAAFNRGNHFRRIGEFDKALAVYEHIVQEDENDAEAHWCCALCRFGIEYVEDPASYEWLPTCHRASFDNFLEDVDYLAAVEHSDGITRRQYQKDGAKIAEVQRGILATSQNEEPFDVFICYKESDDTGSRTVDSTLAQDIYYQLTEQGRRVFFARITLEDKAGAQYEPYIFAALNSAKVMIAVGTKPEHFNAVWVKNEWSRFLALMKKDRSKLLIPCYRDMDPYDLPEQLSVLQSYDMGKIGFIQDLIRGVSKVLDVGKKPKVQETIVVQGESGNLAALLKRGSIALEDQEWDKADAFFEKALDLDAECAEAYFGKLLAERQCSTTEEFIHQERRAEPSTSGKQLSACPENEGYIAQAVKEFQIPLFLTEHAIRAKFEKFDRSYESIEDERRQEFQRKQQDLAGDKLFSRAVRYARDDRMAQIQKTILDAYQAKIAEGQRQDAERKARITQNYAEFLEKTRREIAQLYEDTLKNLSADYAAAVEEQKSASETGKIGGIKEKRTAATLFRVTAERFCLFGPYKDSPARADACAKEAERLRKEIAEEEAQRKEQEKRNAEEERRRQAELKHREKEEQKRQERRKRRNKKISIAAVFVIIAALAAAAYISFKNHQDSQYVQAKTLLEAGKYSEAAAIFKNLGGYGDAKERFFEAKYQMAEKLLDAGDISAAAIAFGMAGDYLDAQAQSFALWDEIVVRNTISAGNTHTAGLSSDGTVTAVGYNVYGRCDVEDWTEMIEVSVHLDTVGLKADGTVVTTDSSLQRDVEKWTDIVAVSAGRFHIVGLKSDGTVVAAGYNKYNQCNVKDWTDIVAIFTGNCHTVGLKLDGTVVAVGENESGQCDVDSWTDIVAVSAGYEHTVGLKADGTVVAVGENNYGQCDVKDWTGIVAISSCESHTVGLKADGTVVAVGGNDYGQCDVKDWTGIVAVSTGSYSHTVGLRSDGTVVAVGRNENGQCDVESWTGIKLPNT